MMPEPMENTMPCENRIVTGPQFRRFGTAREFGSWLRNSDVRNVPDVSWRCTSFLGHRQTGKIGTRQRWEENPTDFMLARERVH